MAEKFTLEVVKPFLYGRKVRDVGELVDLDSQTAKDLLHRKRVCAPGENKPAPVRAPSAPAAKAKRS